MNTREILEELKSMGSPSIKKVLINHGIREPFFGVKVADLKKIQKGVKKDYQLALDLYDTGNYDAMYLAGLIADDGRMTKKDLQRWVEKAYCGALVTYTVPWVAAGSLHGGELALEWIESKEELTAAAGWSTMTSLVSFKDESELDLTKIKQLLLRAQKSIHQQPDEVRSAMNRFVIAIGTYVAPLSDAALQAGEKIGKVTVDAGNTACEVPYSPDYIRKARQAGKIGKKRPSAKC